MLNRYTERAAWRPGLALGRSAVRHRPRRRVRLRLGVRAADVRPLLFIAIGANLFQVGFIFLPEKLAPDITRLDPLQGFGRLFSLAALCGW